MCANRSPRTRTARNLSRCGPIRRMPGRIWPPWGGIAPRPGERLGRRDGARMCGHDVGTFSRAEPGKQYRWVPRRGSGGEQRGNGAQCSVPGSQFFVRSSLLHRGTISMLQYAPTAQNSRQPWQAFAGVCAWVFSLCVSRTRMVARFAPSGKRCFQEVCGAG